MNCLRCRLIDYLRPAVAHSVISPRHRYNGQVASTPRPRCEVPQPSCKAIKLQVPQLISEPPVELDEIGLAGRPRERCCAEPILAFAGTVEGEARRGEGGVRGSGGLVVEDRLCSPSLLVSGFWGRFDWTFFFLRGWSSLCFVELSGIHGSA
ncbi:hypothetical protein BaRGS_00025979 [Batillaria attramentaria]|uniref:Uncharacterized protein n=1 Tax=Batillaria attramentaria TaxID=370345 RepID=A0ABD0K7B4_9CAEN